MLIPTKLKLNRYQKVAIPKRKEIFSRYGSFNPMATQYTGDEFAPIGQSKIDQIREIDAEYQQYLSKE